MNKKETYVTFHSVVLLAIGLLILSIFYEEEPENSQQYVEIQKEELK